MGPAPINDRKFMGNWVYFIPICGVISYNPTKKNVFLGPSCKGSLHVPNQEKNIISLLCCCVSLLSTLKGHRVLKGPGVFKGRG